MNPDNLFLLDFISWCINTCCAQLRVRGMKLIFLGLVVCGAVNSLEDVNRVNCLPDLDHDNQVHMLECIIAKIMNYVIRTVNCV